MRWLVSVVVLAAVASTVSAQSHEWPQRPVRIIVPYAPGGNADEVARIVALRLSEAFGQQFAVENRAGATGTIAAETVARSPPDGYTLLLATLPQLAIVPAMLNTSFDPVKDFSPVSVIATNALVLVAHPSLPVTSVADLVAYARDQHGQLTYAAAGIGSVTHLAMALFLKRAGVEMTPVMYKGGAAMLTDVIAGQVKVYVSNVSTLIPFADSDKLRLLAVTGAQRVRSLPKIPTLIESGYPGFKVVNWTGLVAPAGTPKSIIDRLATEVTRAVNDPAVAARLTATGVDPLGTTPEEFAGMITADISMWADAVKSAGVQK